MNGGRRRRRSRRERREERSQAQQQQQTQPQPQPEAQPEEFAPWEVLGDAVMTAPTGLGDVHTQCEICGQVDGDGQPHEEMAAVHDGRLYTGAEYAAAGYGAGPIKWNMSHIECQGCTDRRNAFNAEVDTLPVSERERRAMKARYRREEVARSPMLPANRPPTPDGSTNG